MTCTPRIVRKKAANYESPNQHTFLHAAAGDNTHCHVNGNDRKPYERKCIPPLGALWSITEGKKVTHDEQAEVEIIEDKVDNMNSSNVETLVLHCVRQYVLFPRQQVLFLLERLETTYESDIIIPECKP